MEFKKQFRAALLMVMMAILFLGTASTSHASDNVLLWFFNDPDIMDIDGSTWKADTLVGRGSEAEGLTANAVRIKTTDDNGDTLFLDLGDSVRGWLDSWDVPDHLGQNKAGPSYANLASLSDDASRVFTMELGYLELSDDQMDIVKWIVLASGSDSFANLAEHGHIISSELSYQGGMPWSPGMVVPEPTTLPLVMIGFGFLMLKRKMKQ